MVPKDAELMEAINRALKISLSTTPIPHNIACSGTVFIGRSVLSYYRKSNKVTLAEP